MADQSHLDNKYFIDENIYNCPFCNRRHVSYALTYYYTFDWSEGKKCYVYFAQCLSCNNKSMHLSFSDIAVSHAFTSGGANYYRFRKYDLPDNLDEQFFYSVPTSFFVLDRRIPKILRELVTEAEGSLKSNFLTGASACARKVVYELGRLQKASGDNYEERIKSLKVINSNVDPAFFDTLLTIQQVTSSKVHEESYDGWEAKHLRLILSTLAEVLHEIYVVPAVREEKRKAILSLKDEVLSKPKQNLDKKQ
jgi:hypothetical protein